MSGRSQAYYFRHLMKMTTLDPGRSTAVRYVRERPNARVQDGGNQGEFRNEGMGRSDVGLRTR
jgi:hypothetical protein